MSNSLFADVSASTSVAAKPSRDLPLSIERWPAQVQKPALNPLIERRIEQILSGMSAEEKVGQVIQCEIGSVTPADVRKYHLGAVLNGGGSYPGGNQSATAKDWVQLAQAYFEASMDTSDGKQAIPILWGTDAVRGHNNVKGATLFPHNIGLGAANDPALVKAIAGATALEMQATGIHWTFAPTVAVPQSISWGRTYEGYSRDPERVVPLMNSYLNGLQGQIGEQFLDADRVLGTAKHFIGDGATANGIDQGDVFINEAELSALHGASYAAALEAGARSVMASFNSWQGDKLHGHKYLLTDVLKGRMGFTGFVVGDWNGHGQLPGCSNGNCPDALLAGLDMYMAPKDWRRLYHTLLKQVTKEDIPQARLDDAVRRILRVKMELGLFDSRSPASYKLAGEQSVLGAPEHRNLAREAVRQSLVLLKNANQLLPLDPRQRILVAGDGADNIAKQVGGWSLTWQGTGLRNEHFPGGESVLDGIKHSVEAAGGEVVEIAELLAEEGNISRPAVAIMVYGEDPYAEGHGDQQNLSYSANRPNELRQLKQFNELGIPVVSVFLSGRPMWINPELNASDAFVAAWLPGSEGGGIADVLFRGPNGNVGHVPTGTLPYDWPSMPDITSVAEMHEQEAVLFPIGYGLTYGDEAVEALAPAPVTATGGAGAPRVINLLTDRNKSCASLYIAGGDGRRVPDEFVKANSLDGHVQIEPVDKSRQEDARRITWFGQGHVGIASGMDPGKSDAEPSSLTISIRVVKSQTPGTLSVWWAGQDQEKSLTELLGVTNGGVWEDLVFGLDVGQINDTGPATTSEVFYIKAEGAAEIEIAEIKLTCEEVR